MIVVYRGNPLLWHAIGRWVIKVRTFSMVNILHDSHEHIVPEHVPWYGSNEPVAQQAINLLRTPEALLAQRERLLELIRNIDHPGASTNVAKLVIEMTGGAPVAAEHADDATPPPPPPPDLQG